MTLAVCSTVHPNRMHDIFFLSAVDCCFLRHIDRTHIVYSVHLAYVLPRFAWHGCVRWSHCGRFGYFAQLSSIQQFSTSMRIHCLIILFNAVLVSTSCKSRQKGKKKLSTSIERGYFVEQRFVCRYLAHSQLFHSSTLTALRLRYHFFYKNFFPEKYTQWRRNSIMLSSCFAPDSFLLCYWLHCE